MQTSSISVVLATYNRCESLEVTLASIASMDTTGLDWEVVVVDNGSTDATRQVLSDFSGQLPLRVLEIPEPSHSAAMNVALDQHLGDLVIFTDDDVLLAETWVKDYVTAAKDFADGIVFCGPITPEFPAGTPEWLKRHPLRIGAYSYFDPSIERGFLPLNFTPFGPNFCARRISIADLRYRLDLGPSSAHGALSFDDTDFLNELRRRHGPFRAGGGFVYVPTASVQHRVRSEQTTAGWLYSRFYNFGRSAVIVSGIGGNRRIPSPLVHEIPLERDDRRLEIAAELNFYLGELTEFQNRSDKSRADSLREELRRCKFLKHQALICAEAQELVADLLRLPS